MSLRLTRKAGKAFGLVGTAALGCPQRAGEGACPYTKRTFQDSRA